MDKRRQNDANAFDGWKNIYSVSLVNRNGEKVADATEVKFYRDLLRTINTVPSNDLLLIMEDFNARVGVQQNHTSNNVIGPHGTDRINENG